MNKKATEKTEETKETKQPAYVGELLKNGTVTLTAKTRDELDKMVSEIPADIRYGAGAVGKNFETGVFTLRLDIV
jgi:hypothetical protein